MDIQKEKEAFQKFCEENFDFENHEQTYFDEKTQCYENESGEDTDSINMAWAAWQAAKAQVPEGFVLVEDKPIAYMVQNKFWKGEFEVKLLNEMPEQEFEGDSYDIEIPLYAAEAQEHK